MKLALAIAVILLFPNLPLAEAAKKPAAKQKKVADANPKLPTKLPAYKGKKKVSLDFENNSGTHVTTVIARTPLPLEKALDDQAAARQAQKPLEEVVVKTPSRVEPSPKIEFLPQRSQELEPIEIAIQTPAPQTQPVRPQPTSPVAKAPVAKVEAAPQVKPMAQPAPLPAPAVQKALPPTASQQVAPAKAPSTTPAVTVVTRTTAPDPLTARPFRLATRTSYVSAKYSDLESRLENGATTLGLGLFYAIDLNIEGRLSLELGHGFDQEVNLQNTRMSLVRIDGVYFFMPGTFQPMAGAGLGYASHNVRSYRSVDGSTITLKEHLKSGSALLAPFAGGRIHFSPTVALDLSLEYLAFVGGESASSLGGLTCGLNLNFEI